MVGHSVDDDPLTYLHRSVRHHGEDLRAFVVGLEGSGVDPAEHARDNLGSACDLLGNGLELVGLVAEHDDVGALGQFAVRGNPLASQLVSQRLRAARAAVGAEHGLTPATRQRTRHVSGADESDLHRRQAYRRVCAPAGAVHPDRRSGLIEEALLDQPRALLGGDLDVLRGQQEDLVGDPLHPAVQRVGEAAGEVDQAL